MGVRVPPPALIVDLPKPLTSRAVLISALLGINCWVTCAALPSWHLAVLGALSNWILIIDVFAFFVLVTGILLLWRCHSQSAGVLLGLYPLLVLAPALVQPSLIRASVLSPASVVLAGISFSIYLIGTCWAVSTVQTKQVLSQTIPLEDHRMPRRKWLSIILLPTAVGVAAITIGSSHIRTFELEHVGQLRLLSVAALAIWTMTLFGIIAPALRHKRPWPVSAASRGAALVWLLVVALSAIMLTLALRN